MFATKINDISWSEIIVKYGQRYQADCSSAQASLFGDMETIETARPSLPE